MPWRWPFRRGHAPSSPEAHASATTHTEREPAVTDSPDGSNHQSVLSSHTAEAEALAAWFVAADEELRHKNWRQGFASYPRLNLAEDPVPWATPPTSVRSARFCLVGSGGLYLPDQPRFEDGAIRGDFSWRALPVDTDLAATRIAHEHYDHTAAEADRNAAYPLDRLRELAAAGEIGGLTPTHFSFMGYIPDWVGVIERLAPALAEQVVAQRPDAAILVPV